jgi:hypothetical protein
VRDLDAHSWVEVYFNGIGWVRFDPTPSTAPAESQSSGPEAPGPADAGTPPPPGKIDTRGGPPPVPQPKRVRPTHGGPAWWLAAIGAAALLALAAALAIVRVAATARRSGRELLEAQVAELRAALERLGLRLPPETTLLALEQRLRRLAGPAAARYPAALRAARFSANGATPPTAGERRALRRALAARRGPLVRLRALLALPPSPFSRP